MTLWLQNLDDFLGRYPHIVSALEAFSTFAAVLVSLTLALVAQRSNRTQIKAFASIGIILHSTLEGKPTPTYLTAEITNMGIMPIQIPLSFFHWKVPFKRGAWLVNPLDYTQTDEWIPQKKYPVEIRPRGSVTFYLSEISVFRATIRETFSGASFIQRCQFHFFRPRVVTDDGKIFTVKTDRSLRKELRALRAFDPA